MLIKYKHVFTHYNQQTRRNFVKVVSVRSYLSILLVVEAVVWFVRGYKTDRVYVWGWGGG